MTGVVPPEVEGLLFIMTMYGTFSISQVCDKDHYHVTIVANDSKDELEKLLQRFTHDDPVFSPWFRNAKRVDDECCVVNTLQAIERPFYRNVILVGDACWSYQFSNALSLTAGYHLGHALTKAFLDGKMNEVGVGQYLEWYDTQIYKPYGQLPFRGGILQNTSPQKSWTTWPHYLQNLPRPPRVSRGCFTPSLKPTCPCRSASRRTIQQSRRDSRQWVRTWRRTWRKKEKAGFPNR